MRFDKFTLKAQEVIQTSQHLAEKFGHQQLEPEHLVRAILEQREGVLPPLLGKIGADQQQLLQSLDKALVKLPKVTGAGTGFKFWDPTPRALYDTIGWAVSTYYDRKQHLATLIRRAMSRRFSWDHSAREYVRAYARAIEIKGS